MKLLKLLNNIVQYIMNKPGMKLYLLMLFILGAASVIGQNLPVPKVQLNLDNANNPEDFNTTLQILIMLTVLSLAPAILIMTTAFTRIIIVMSFLRSALGVQNIPPNQVMIGLSLFLTFFVMAPVFDKVNVEAYQPYMRKEITFDQAFAKAQIPMRDFMLKQTYDRDLALFIKLRNEPPPKTPDDLNIFTVIPAFITSELKTAFIIGFYIYIPFIVIDLVVASTLMSMGMMMLPPMVISMPAKILVFLLSNGWYVLIAALAQGFR